jgi:serine/threonine protein kinase/tetratricopeptide (TPR) repeat protein
MSEETEDDKTQPSLLLTKGSVFSHYRIIDKIGAGGMGEVYLAEDTNLNRHVALKFLSDRLESREEVKNRFQREVLASASLNHPHIVNVYEVSEHSGRQFYAMEHVDGRPLGDLITKNELTIEQTIDLSIQICEGLLEAHNNGVIHRDIKPSNILVSNSGRAKLVDFGLASVSGMERLTKTGYAIGTIGYVSPEQVRAEEADHRSDIFSFGIVLYEMLTGRQPFRKNSEAATLHAILNENPKPVTQYNDAIPAGIQYIIDRALEKDPEKRYQSVDGLLEDLTCLDKGMDFPTATYTRFPRPSGKTRARFVFYGLSVLMIAALAILLALPSGRLIVSKWLSINSVPSEKHLAVLPFTVIGNQKSYAVFCDGLMETLSSKLTQMEQFRGSLRVVPASEVRERGIFGVKQARQTFGINLAVTGSVQNLDRNIRMTLNLIDAKSERQLNSAIIDYSLDNVSELQDTTIIYLANMLELQLQPHEKQFLVAGGTSRPDAYDLYLKGRGYLQHYESSVFIDTAIDLFHQALISDPNYALAQAGLGEAYWRMYKITKETDWIDPAIKSSLKALEINDQLAQVHTTLGLIYKGTGQYEDAIKEFHEALQLDPVNYDACQGLATTFGALNRIDEAEETYLRAIKLKPDDWKGYYDLAYFYIMNGRLDEAKGRLNEAASLAPYAIVPFNDLGALYYYLDDWDKARIMWEGALEIGSSYAACSNLGALYYLERRYIDAVRMYETALKLDDRDYAVWGNLAQTYYQLPDGRKKALELFQKATDMAEKQRKINPRDVIVLADLAEYQAKLDNPDRADFFIKQALSLASDNVELMVRAGGVYEELGDRENALKWIIKSIDNHYPVTILKRLPELEQMFTDPRLKERLKATTNDGGA